MNARENKDLKEYIKIKPFVNPGIKSYLFHVLWFNLKKRAKTCSSEFTEFSSNILIFHYFLCLSIDHQSFLNFRLFCEGLNCPIKFSHSCFFFGHDLNPLWSFVTIWVDEAALHYLLVNCIWGINSSRVMISWHFVKWQHLQ